jgi:RNA polymerase sigma-70 factor, ECF subfamily
VATPVEDPADMVALAERIRSGDGAAEGELVALFQRRVFVMALVRTHNQETARDLAQETMLGVLCSLRDGKLREAERLPAYVLGTAHNVINNFLRARRLRPEAVPLPDDLPAAAGDDGHERAEHEFLARRALSTLAPGDRLVLLLTLVDGLKPGEIAARLGLSSEVVRKRKSRAVERARAALGMVSRS